jgi:hypothetical protein
MDRILTGIMIALAALVLSGGLMRDVMAEETLARAPVGAEAVKSQVPVVNGLRSERVLSLLLTLEALRAAPALLDSTKG